jgi:1-acyl-sn-glycerol-3-phosphate acyltransferase
MKTLVSILEWAVAVIVFIIFLMWFLIVATLFPYATYIVWVRKFLKAFISILLIRVKVEGIENIDPKKTYIFMPNHVSMLDIPLVLGFIPVDFWGIQAASHFKTPLYGWVLKKYGNIPIDRSSPRASLKTILEAVEKIKDGRSILIFPEGTRSLTPEIGEFKKLPFLMAKKAEVPIIPIAFIGLYNINNKANWHIKPGKIRMVFGKEISSETIASMTENQLRDHVRERVQTLLD